MADDATEANRAALHANLVQAGVVVASDLSEDELNRLVWSRVFGIHGDELSVARLAERTGLAPEDCERFLRALGFKRNGPWNEREVATLSLIGDACAAFGAETALHLTRVIGAASNRVAEAIAEAVRIDYGAPLRAESTDRYLLGVEAISNEMLPRLAELMDSGVRRHLLELVDTEWHADSDAPIMVARQTIGFADMVGFTARSARSSTAQLAEVIDRFESEVASAVVGAGGRVVKYIGDEVMFAFAHAENACTCARRLFALAEAATIPGIRIGIATGEVISRFGDYYGPVVNTAARLVQAAPPGCAFVTSEVASLVENETFVNQGDRELRGIAEPVCVMQLV